MACNELTAGGTLVVKQGLSSRAFADGGSPFSPPIQHPFTQEMPRFPVLAAFLLNNFCFTECDAICPRMTENLVRVQELLGPRVGQDIFMVSITLQVRRGRRGASSPAIGITASIAERLGIRLNGAQHRRILPAVVYGRRPGLSRPLLEGTQMAGESAHFGLRARPPTPAVRPFDLPPRLQAMLDRANASLAEIFRGLDGGAAPTPGLFALAKTGVSLAPIVEIARFFVSTLTADQRKAAQFAIGDETWRMWSNIHPWLMRHGVCLADLDGHQREAALSLLQESLSATGYRSARDVMRLNEHALEITGKPEEYGEWYYWISIFGTPSADEPWGWQIDGHHLNINCFVLGDQLVMTPTFMGSEPVLARFGKHAGTRVFAAEEERGYALMSSLSLDERRRATIGKDLPSELLAAAFGDNRRIEPAGIRYHELSPEGRERLEALLATYTGRIRPGHAEIRYAEAKRHLSDTHFAWIGSLDEASPFYYRILSPVILVEFDHQSGIIYDNDTPSRDHIHTVVRTPNGNDYGRDLLRQHYAHHDHSHHTHHSHHSTDAA